MEENVIKLNNDNILRFTIEDEKGEKTGEYLEFDLEDTELPLKYQELVEKDKKNKQWLENQFIIIDKKEDIKGKKLLSKNEEDKLKAVNEFFKKEEEVYNMFLGEGGVKKLSNGRTLGWTTFNEIDDIISKIIVPKLDENMVSITEKIKNKYKISDKEDNVLQ